MDGELAYILANASVIPVWACMILAPRSALTRRLVATPLVPLLYALLYSGLLVASFAGSAEGDMLSMANLRVAFATDLFLLLAWVHYLCFDMVVGMWEVRDSAEHPISSWWLAPCLVCTLMFGPFGFAMYCAIRWFKTGATGWETPSPRA